MKTLRPHFVLSWVTHLGRVSHCVMRPPEASWISTPREDLSPPANTQDWHARDGGHPLRIRTSRLSQASAWWVSPPWLLQSQERTPIKNHSAKPPPNSWTSATVGNKCYNYWKTVTTTTPPPPKQMKKQRVGSQGFGMVLQALPTGDCMQKHSLVWFPDSSPP